MELSARLVTNAWPWAASSGRSLTPDGTSSSFSDSPGEASQGGDGGRASPGFKEGGGSDGGGGGGVFGGKTMLDAIVARAGDSAPTVRYYGIVGGPVESTQL